MRVGGERRLRIVTGLAGPDGELSMTRLCERCAEVVGMDGAGIMLMVGDTPAGSVCTTDAVADRIEDLQYTLGEGPCVDAYAGDRPVLEADLVDPVTARWPAFTPGVVSAGVRAVFGFPVRVGAARLGALNLYRLRPGPLSDDQHADALVLADVVGEVLLALQADAPVGQLSADLEVNANLRFVVAQASGMIAVQLDVPIEVALVRLRGYAFAHNRPVDDVAADIVDRRLRFDGAADASW
jgi:GAF domain